MRRQELRENPKERERTWRSEDVELNSTPASLATLQLVCLGCKLGFRGKALTGGKRVWTLTRSRIMYDWGSTQEPALALNVGKPAVTTLSLELQQRPLAVFQETQDIVKERNGETHTRQKKHPLVPISTLLTFLIFLVICSQHTLCRKDFLFCLLLSLRLCLGVVQELNLDQK